MISKPGYNEKIGGEDRNLLLRNGEIERFEDQYAPFGIFALFDQCMGRGSAPQVRHVRDLIALGLVGGGMSDRAADALIAGLGPEENIALRGVAQRLLGVTLIPDLLVKKPPGKKRGGSPSAPAVTSDPIDTTPES